MNIRNYRQKRRETGRIWAGLFLLLAGATLILHEEGLIIPDTLYNWHLLVVGIGLFIGAARNFRGAAWIVIMAIGGFGLVQDYNSALHIRAFIWPCVIILVGLIFLFRRRYPWEDVWGAKWHERKQEWQANQQQRHRNEKEWHQAKRDWKRDARKEWRETARDWKDSREFARTEQDIYTEDFVDLACSFGSSRKKIISKNFKGGDIVTFMGHTEIDLREADIQGIVRLNVTQIMGSSRIVVPAHWEIRSDVNAVFAGFEDKREEAAVYNPDKVLVIVGTSAFGGIEVRTRSISIVD
jgi:Cell wall-active antibiotics response 4TMS YvqF